jgi:hypothetical protein
MRFSAKTRDASRSAVLDNFAIWPVGENHFVLTGSIGEDEVTEKSSLGQVEFAMVFGSALRELYSGFRTGVEMRNAD